MSHCNGLQSFDTSSHQFQGVFKEVNDFADHAPGCGIGDDDDDLLSWRLHLERQKQLAEERQEQMKLLRTYRERRHAERRAKYKLHAARAAAEQGPGTPRDGGAGGGTPPWDDGNQPGRGRERQRGTPEGELAGAPASMVSLWRELVERWEALHRLVQGESLDDGEGAPKGSGSGRQQAGQRSSGVKPTTAAATSAATAAAAATTAVATELTPCIRLQIKDMPWPPSTSGLLQGLAMLEGDAFSATATAASRRSNSRGSNSGNGGRTASPRSALRRAYLSAVRRWHPDKSAAVLAALPPGERDTARQRLLHLCQELNRQYETLQDQMQRGGI